MKRLLLITIMSLLIFGCGSDDKSAPTAPAPKKKEKKDLNQDLHGLIGAANWTYSSGYAKVDFTDNSRLRYTIYQDNIVNVCGFHPLPKTHVIFSLPKKIGTYSISLATGDTVTLNDGKVNNIALQGTVEIVSVTNSKVVGKMDVKANDDNKIYGKFEITFCK